MGGQNVSVNFKVGGSELNQYMDNIRSKSDKMAGDAIRNAIQQTEKGKEQLKVINDQIAAIEKKVRIETQAARSIISDRRQSALSENEQLYGAKKNEVYANRRLTESEKREKILALTGSEAAGTDKIKSDYRENLIAVKEQERQSKLQTAISKEQLITLKETARENVRAITTGNLKLSSVMENASTDEEKLVAKLTQEGLAAEKKSEIKEKAGTGLSVFTGLLTVDNINKLVSSVTQLTQTQNGFDLIKSSSQGIGNVVGGIVGGAVAAIFTEGLGIAAGASIGSSIGSAFGGGIGEFEQRRAMAKEEFYKARNRFKSVTGNDSIGGFNGESTGLAASQFLGMQSEYARRRGNSGSSTKTTMDALFAEKGVGVDQGTSAGLIEMQRSAKENNRDLANLIGGVLAKGQGSYFKNGDNTFLNEFLGKFGQRQKEFLKTQSSVATSSTYDVMSRFNSLGGEFATSDPRSSGLLNTINGSISNPNTDFKKALSFYALRKANPNMGIADLIEEQQKGLSSKTYLSSMMDMVSGMGGSEDSKRLNFAGLLGLEGQQKFASDVYSGYKSGKFRGGINQSELSGAFDFKGKAESNTSNLEKTTAHVQNGLLMDRYDSIGAMTDAFKVAFEQTMSGAVIEMKNGTITFPARALVQQNATRKAAEGQKLVTDNQAVLSQGMSNISSGGGYNPYH